ncbi:hypothetical protein D3874_03000 [Oleomonas cavernae]|uniref:Uncharacterized protein n=1 Tax=Oleomonas cavernae TaxID=2320859 RepID=A0A418WU83_9PROT|nr:hypothetical protein [Oleomonas cavernae]RJF94798.1 hypothetical protein D3874_03000 [Oleomonas cavernae]
MAKGAILHDNLSLDTGVVLSGGTWALPLTNLLDPRMIARPARCTAIANPVNSRIEIDLGANKAVRWIALCHHTLSLQATFAYRASTTSGHTGDILNVASQLVLGRVVSSLSLPWEEPNFWTGQPRVKDIAGYSRHLVIPLAGGTVARYWRIDLSDTANTAGQFDIGYLMMGDPIVAEYNFDLGRSLNRRSRSIVDETPGGGVIVDRRRIARRQTMQWSMLSKDEAMRLYDMSINRDVVDPVLFVPDIDDTGNLFREAWPARITGGGEPRRQDRRFWTLSLELEEILA